MLLHNGYCYQQIYVPKVITTTVFNIGKFYFQEISNYLDFALKSQVSLKLFAEVAELIRVAFCDAFLRQLVIIMTSNFFRFRRLPFGQVCQIFNFAVQNDLTI